MLSNQLCAAAAPGLFLIGRGRLTRQFGYLSWAHSPPTFTMQTAHIWIPCSSWLAVCSMVLQVKGRMNTRSPSMSSVHLLWKTAVNSQIDLDCGALGRDGSGRVVLPSIVHIVSYQADTVFALRPAWH